MAMVSMPWMVGGGAKHPVELVRLGNYVSTGGAEGVAESGSLKVTALPTPGASVRVMPGGAVLRNVYAGGGEQSYIVRNGSATDVPITPTTSAGGRTDLIIVRVDDPQYVGDAPADPQAYEYARLQVIEGVPATTRTARELNLGYPALALALVTLPASTATIQEANIADLRRVAVPKIERGQNLAFPTDAETIPTSNYSHWPKNATPVDIPEWATTALVTADLSGILATGTGQTVAGIRTYVGPGMQPADATTGVELAQNGILIDEGGSGPRRIHANVAGRHDVRKYAGQRVYILTQGLRSKGAGMFTADSQTTLNLEWTFMDEPR